MNNLQQSWKKVKLGDYFRVKHGYAFKGAFFADSGPYLLLTPGNFKAEGGIMLKEEKEKYYVGKFPSEFLLNKGDFLIVMTDLTQNAPILGSPAIIKDDNKFLHNQRLGKIVNLKEAEIDSTFLYYLFNSIRVRGQIKATATGTTVKHTAPERIYAVEVELHPLPIQCKIAAILSAYDDLIDKTAQRIKILEEMAQSLYREWFVHFRYPGHEKNTMVESELGMIPEEWEIKNLADLSYVTMGQSPSSQFYNESCEGLPFHQGVTDFGEHFPTDRVYCTTENRTAEAGDILFSVRAPVGRINIANKKIVIGRGLSAIRSKFGNQTFILLQLKECFQKEDIIGNGSIFQSVTKNEMYNIRLLQPSPSIISSFEEFAQPIIRNIEILTRKNANLRQACDLLLPKLISGEIDIEALDIKILDIAAPEQQVPIITGHPELINATQLALPLS